MTRNLKTIVSLLLALCLVFSLAATAFAKSDSEIKVFYDDVNKIQFSKAFIVENGVFREVSYSEYMTYVTKNKEVEANVKRQTSIFNIPVSTEPIQAQAVGGNLVYHSFAKSSESAYVDYSKGKRISTYAEAWYIAQSVSITQTATISKSISVDFTVNSSLINAILNKASISGTVQSATSNATQHSGPVPYYKRGFWMFYPKLNHIKGTMTRTTYMAPAYIVSYSETSQTNATFPIKVNGFADGAYTLVIEDLYGPPPPTGN